MRCWRQHIPVVERTSSVLQLHHLLMWHAPNAADVRTILSCSLLDIDPAVLLGRCFLFCISGLFLSSPL